MRRRSILCAALAMVGACGGDRHDHDARDAAARRSATPAPTASTAPTPTPTAPTPTPTAPTPAPTAPTPAPAGPAAPTPTSAPTPSPPPRLAASASASASASTSTAAATDERDEHAVFDLGDNRLLAHRIVDGDLVVDAGSAGFARYTRFGLPVPHWTLRAIRDGARAALADRLASLDLPLTAEQAAHAPLLILRVWAPSPRTLAVKVNGRKADEHAGSVPLEPGWQTVAVGVAPGRWSAGENQVVLETAAARAAPVADAAAAPPSRAAACRGRRGCGAHAPGSAHGARTSHVARVAAPPIATAAHPPAPGRPDERIALAWIRVAAEPQPDRDPRGAAAYDAAARRFLLTSGGGLAYYALVPDGAHLVAHVVGDGCRVDVKATTSDGAFAAGLLGGAAPAGAPGTAPGGAAPGGDAPGGTAPRGAPPPATGTHGRVDLSTMSGRAVRLELRVRDCPLAILDAVRITIPGPAPIVPAPGAPPKYVILWMMDAFRAQSVRPFTPGARPDVPAFERLARTGTVFRQYYDQGNESQTSHASIWTATYPAVHNVRLAGVGGTWKLAPTFQVLGQLVRAAGYHTIGVTGNGFITDDGGWSRGFDEYRNMMREKGIVNGVLYGERVVAAALERLHKSLDQPTFLFLGTVDTHGPWIARRPWITTYDPGPYDGPFQEFGTAFDLGITPDSMGCAKVPPPRDLQRLRAIYDSAVSYQDARLGDLVAQLEKWGIYDQTLLIVTADHGEEMFEHDRCGHGGSLVETLVRVPLLVHYPARFPGGAVVDEGAEGVDLVPTVLDALGAGAPAQAQGASLRELAFGVGRGWPRPSYASMFEYAHTLRLGTWKATVARSGTPSIYDVAADPLEQADVAATRPVERRLLTDALGLFLEERTVWKKSAWGVVTAMTPRAAVELDPP